MTGERALWVAVLEAVILDARKGRDLDYIDTPNFRTVASLAGLDPDAARDAIKALTRARQSRGAA